MMIVLGCLSLVIVLSVAFVLSRHSRDIRIVLRRGTLYLATIIAVALVFFSIEFIFEKFVYNNDEVVDIIASVFGAFALSKFRAFFKRRLTGFF